MKLIIHRYSTELSPPLGLMGFKMSSNFSISLFMKQARMIHKVIDYH